MAVITWSIDKLGEIQIVTLVHNLVHILVYKQ